MTQFKKTAVAVALFLAVGSQAHAAGLSLGGLAGAATGSSSSSGSSVDASGAQDQLTRSYVAANKEVLTAQSYLAQAVGLKEVAAKAKATADALTEGATKGSLEDSNKVLSSTSEQIQASLKDRGATAESLDKAAYQQGLSHLGTGVLRYVNMRQDVTNFSNAAQSQISSASPMDKLALTNKLSTGTYIASTVPTQASNLATTLKIATDYAKSQDIPVPKDATAALSSGAF